MPGRRQLKSPIFFRFHGFALHSRTCCCAPSCCRQGIGRLSRGYGTLDELFEVLTLVQTRKIKSIPGNLVDEHSWRRAFDADYLAEEGVIGLEDHALFWLAKIARQIWDGILCRHNGAGEPLAK